MIKMGFLMHKFKSNCIANIIRDELLKEHRDECAMIMSLDYFLNWGGGDEALRIWICFELCCVMQNRIRFLVYLVCRIPLIFFLFSFTPIGTNSG